jgi:hypothetical protein
MEGVFENKDGDRGANSIPTKQRQNMHALWDQLLVLKQAIACLSEPDFRSAAATEPAGLV